MKIIIIGAGRVGSSVAESLVSEANDITVIDSDPARVADLQDRFDLRGLSATQPCRPHSSRPAPTTRTC
jgi:trk system potassium uptake protein